MPSVRPSSVPNNELLLPLLKTIFFGTLEISYLVDLTKAITINNEKTLKNYKQRDASDLHMGVFTSVRE